MSCALVARGDALFEAGAQGCEARVNIVVLEIPDAGCGRLGGLASVVGKLVPGLAESGVFEEGCHCCCEVESGEVSVGFWMGGCRKAVLDRCISLSLESQWRVEFLVRISRHGVVVCMYVEGWRLEAGGWERRLAVVFLNPAPFDSARQSDLGPEQRCDCRDFVENNNLVSLDEHLQKGLYCCKGT